MCSQTGDPPKWSSTLSSSNILHAHMGWICTQVQPHPHTWRFQLAKNFVTAGFVELPFHTKYVSLLHPFSGASLSCVLR